MFNGLVLNPAYAGSHGNLSATALYRNQWTGIDGAPVTQTFSLHSPLNNDKVGLGINIVNDKIGITNTLNIHGSYSYMIQTGAGKLALGIQAGMLQYKSFFSKISFSDPINEPVQGDNINLIKISFGGGLYYFSDKFYVGLSSPRLSSFKTIKDTLHNPIFASHFFLSSGMIFNLNSILKLKPSLLVKAVQGPLPQFDINTTLYFKDFIGLGLSYRYMESVAAMLQLAFAKNYKIGYSYDYGISGGLQKYNKGSHEIMFQVEFSLKKDKVISPRYF